VHQLVQSKHNFLCLYNSNSSLICQGWGAACADVNTVSRQYGDLNKAILMWATMKNTIKIKHIYKILQTTNFQTVASENVTM